MSMALVQSPVYRAKIELAYMNYSRPSVEYVNTFGLFLPLGGAARWRMLLFCVVCLPLQSALDIWLETCVYVRCRLPNT
jgi:hypothetical protein